jgi:hypothetical protein
MLQNVKVQIAAVLAVGGLLGYLAALDRLNPRPGGAARGAGSGALATRRLG